MPRVTAVYKPSDYPEPLDQETKLQLSDLFARLFPGVADPEIDKSHSGLAIAVQNPALALRLSSLSRFMALELAWSRRSDLRELAIQTVNLHFKCDYSFRARIAVAAAAGVSRAQQDALAAWTTSDLFDDEQKLVIEYAQAVAAGDVSTALFARVLRNYGEKGAVEFTALVAFFSFWAIFLNATAPDLNSGPDTVLPQNS